MSTEQRRGDVTVVALQAPCAGVVMRSREGGAGGSSQRHRSRALARHGEGVEGGRDKGEVDPAVPWWPRVVATAGVHAAVAAIVQCAARHGEAARWRGLLWRRTGGRGGGRVRLRGSYSPQARVP